MWSGSLLKVIFSVKESSSFYVILIILFPERTYWEWKVMQSAFLWEFQFLRIQWCLCYLMKWGEWSFFLINLSLAKSDFILPSEVSQFSKTWLKSLSLTFLSYGGTSTGSCNSVVSISHSPRRWRLWGNLCFLLNWFFFLLCFWIKKAVYIHLPNVWESLYIW